ncbi:MAG: hypothetical protein FJ356_04945 [Thaumarchaeota archaeon]|nr:hypothetical protein [Nitrososphaerota archaeon]
MPYTFDNILITTATGDAYLATDWGTSGTGFTQSHVPISKIAYGDDTTTSRVTTATPLPIYMYGSTGSITVTGTVAGSGTFLVDNINSSSFLKVGGTTFATTLIGVTGTIQGISGGTPLGVTGTVTISNTQFGVYGISGATAIGITGGRRSNYLTDSVSVYGNVGISGSLNLAAATNSISVFGSDAGDKVLSRIYSSDGTTLGVSGDALKVAITNSGVTFSVTIGAEIGITNSGPSGIMVRGTGVTSDHPVLIQGIAADGSIEVSASSNLPVTVQNASLVIDDADLLSALGTSGTLHTDLVSIRTNTSSVSSINDKLTNGTLQVKIVESNKPSTLRSGKKIATITSSQLVSNSTRLNSGVNIKASIDNTSICYVGSSALNSDTTGGFPLSPGESIFIEIGTLSSVYVRCVSGNQTLHYIAS